MLLLNEFSQKNIPFCEKMLSIERECLRQVERQSVLTVYFMNIRVSFNYLTVTYPSRCQLRVKSFTKYFPDFCTFCLINIYEFIFMK